jgi:hypothetical protein
MRGAEAVAGTVAAHLGSHQVSRVIYGAVVGLALVVALEAHPPSSGSVAGLIASTALAVALAELYSELLGARIRLRHPVDADRRARIVDDVLAVAAGAAFPAVFFVLAAAGVIADATAFTLAKWTGLGLIAFYGFCAARLGGAKLHRSLVHAVAAGAIGGLVIVLKALVH